MNSKRKYIPKDQENQGIKDCFGKTIKINGSTACETCNERLTAFGGNFTTKDTEVGEGEEGEFLTTDEHG